MSVVVGVDFGTLSGRALVVRTADGAELGTAVHDYAHGVIDEALGERRLPPEWALQHPADWLAVLRTAVPAALADAGVESHEVVGIGCDFTASTPLPALADGTPLCLVDGWQDRPHAYPKLWKHHAAQAQADRVNAVAAERGETWLARYGGAISSEWQIAKALQVFEEDREAFDTAERWVEASDWIVQQLGGALVRGVSAAGYKGMVQEGALPDPAYFDALAPGFAAVIPKLEGPAGELGAVAGTLTAEMAALTGLPEGIAVAVGNVDAHVTAPAVQATGTGALVAIMGTSTCHIVNAVRRVDVDGMCGVVDGGITAGLWGYEAGQSGVGDILAWFVANQVPASLERAAAARGVSVHELLTELGWARPVGAHGLVALDWHGGNRSVLVDARLSGLVVGMTLATRAEDVYRALVEATAFGARRIVEAFRAGGVPVERFVAAGGLLRNERLMQTYADVLGMPIDVAGSEQAPALGAAIHAAVAAGAHPDISTAADAMGAVERDRYVPDPAAVAAYEAIYRDYLALHDAFGRGEELLMHRLKRRRAEALA
ncbi:ribulokinase [Agrococcus baldri]|uniref:Ribulokinase n=1 Tax=Agrococcus baldri TaxID=153730 RepID=A0AA87RJ95_9MICO|nr:ribulokinase [Agrococcus baldri]GEK79227.1 ribulokinase [Agrococcus baldri]